MEQDIEDMHVQSMLDFRNRDKPINDVEIFEAAAEIASRVKIINGWYEKYQDKFWDRIKTESPDIGCRILDQLDLINSAFEKWRDGRMTWEEVDYSIMRYEKAWREVAVAYR